MYVPPQAVPCICTSCSESSVTLQLTGIDKNVDVINLDCLKEKTNQAGNIADCAILLKQRDMFAIVELKGGQDRDKVERQVYGGLNIIDQLTHDQHLQDFFPIFIYKGRDPTTAFRSMRFELRGISRRIIPRRSDSQLVDILRTNRPDVAF
jgi:hypothetical protein